MSAETMMDRLHEDRSWLQGQPGMRPWHEGCAMLIEQLKAWFDEYGKSLGIRCDSAEARRYLPRLWNCWRHHWQQALESAADLVCDGRLVAQRVRSGEGYCRGRRLGGDPLRDVVLAEAVLQRETIATERFEAEYREFCLRQGRRASDEVGREPDSWWSCLLDHLAGYSHPPGKLSNFVGRCGLRNWLGRVAINFAYDHRTKNSPVSIDGQPEPVGDTEPNQEPELDECLDLLAGFVRRALTDMPGDERLLLYLLHVERLPGKETARVFGVHPGVISRRRARAEDDLQDAMQRHAAREAKGQGYDDCLELLTEHRNFGRFGELLMAELRRARPEDDGLEEAQR